jgi:hypothetical protein
MEETIGDQLRMLYASREQLWVEDGKVEEIRPHAHRGQSVEHDLARGGRMMTLAVAGSGEVL